MGRREVDRKVAEAMKKLTATKEDAVRALAAALDDIDSIDIKLIELNRQRDELIAVAEAKHMVAKTTGWKVRELADAGLSVPRPIVLALTAEAPPAVQQAPAQSTTGDKPALPGTEAAA